jgi:hypothetical protein
MTAIISRSGWIGVDLDGTIAQYEGWKGVAHIGEPIPAMVARVRDYLAQGREVRIFTARMSSPDPDERKAVAAAIAAWTAKHVGKALPATCIKDYAMITLYDDRCKQVEPNTGRVIGEEDEPPPPGSPSFTEIVAKTPMPAAAFKSPLLERFKS